MNNIAFLRDWAPGDVLTADELNTISAVIAMLEAAPPAGGGGAAVTPGGRRVSDGPREMPWQVYTVPGEGALEMRVIPGVVFVGAWNGTAHEARLATLPAGGEKVTDFDPASACTIWLELTGEVSVQEVSNGVTIAGLVDARWQKAELKNPALRVTCTPSESALRVWPIAVYNPEHKQRVTQLLWGDLSALECRGLIDSGGEIVWPQDRSSAEAWTVEAHRSGMSSLCELDFSRDSETVSGTLSACIDEDGALEFYMGAPETEEDPDDPDPIFPDPPVDPPIVDPDPDNPDPDDPYPDYIPVYPDDPPTPPSEPTRVRYGYVAGEGFKSCTLCNNSNDESDYTLYWKLVLDPDFLASICKDLAAEGKVTFGASGTSSGVWATVEMGLGSSSASASGVSVSGNTGLVFHGSNDVDASKKSATAKFTLKCSPSWKQSQGWILSSDELHEAGAFVIREKGTPSDAGFVEALHWYRFRVKKSAFRKQAQNYFKNQLAAITVSDSDSSSSGGSTVSGVLSGTILNPSFSCTLS